jgi:hypothetical protein
MDKVNVESKKLNMDDKDISTDVLDVKEKIYDTRSSHNNKMVEMQYSQSVIDFRLFIGLFVVSLIFGAYTGFKLFNRIKKEL